MTIRTRLTLGAIIYIALALFLVVFLHLTAQQIRETTEKYEQINEITTGVFELQILTNDYLLYYEERAETQWYQRYDSLTERLALMVVKDPEEKLIYDSISRWHEDIKDIFTQLTVSIKERQQLGSEESRLYEERENRLVEHLLIESQAKVSDAYELQLLAQTRLDATQRRGILTVIGFMSAMAAVVAAVFLWIRRSVLSPLGKLQAGTDKIGSGDLDYRLGITTGDELGQLARAFDHMTEGLKTSLTSVDNLKKEITERKKAEEREKHLSLVLRAIRNVNQLITKEKDRDKLLKGSCDNLIENRGYSNAWITLLDESGKLVAHAESGLGKNFLPMVEHLKRGQLPACGQRALEQSEAVVTEDPVSTCTDCPLSSNYAGRSAAIARLEYEGKVYGLLSVSVPIEMATDVEELGLFREVAGDIAFALHNLELEEKRKRAEEALERSEEQLQSIVQTAKDAISITDSMGNITVWNRAAEAMFGYTSDEIIGQPVSILIPERFRTIFEGAFGKTISSREPQSNKAVAEQAGLRKDGSEFPIEISNAQWKTQEDVFFTSIIRDITERKEVEEKAREVETLRRIDRLRSGLLANVSHELRTPLASIKGFASTLLRTDVKWSEEEQKDFLQTIDHETNRLTRLINDLLDMSRIEGGGIKLDKRDYQIAEVLDSIGEHLSSLTERHRLEVIVPPELPPVFVDEMRIGQVLTNLVENAVKFSAEGTLITIEAQSADDRVNVIVSDEGVGIPIEFQDKLFDRFYQAESIVAGKKSGTGLGLSICRGIIEAHGGRIWVASQPGEGSKFGFTLPVGKGEGEIA